MVRHILTLSCPDCPGIVASIAQGLLELGANITDNAQFGDVASSMFCMRTGFDTPIEASEEIVDLLTERAGRLSATLSVRREDRLARVLVMVSKHDHCLVDLLQRRRAGELPVDIVLVVSNHPDLAPTVESYGVQFLHLPINASVRLDSEAQLLALVAERDIDLVVLARYMQILPGSLTMALPGRVINIHHSFLPGFKGARPYHQAWERGVKIIGATAHFVTEELDEGPIIDQDVSRVGHAQSAEQMAIIGKDIERLVLSRAVKAWAEGRVFLLGDRTVVFP